jgi:hypothetical protein
VVIDVMNLRQALVVAQASADLNAHWQPANTPTSSTGWHLLAAPSRTSAIFGDS